jgi:hypothetical protein
VPLPLPPLAPPEASPLEPPAVASGAPPTGMKPVAEPPQWASAAQKAAPQRTEGRADRDIPR